MTIFYHLIQHKIPTFFIGFGVLHGIIIIGALGNGGQRSCFGQCHILNVFAKIRLGSGFHTVRTFAEINLVQVHSQNLIFGIFVLQLFGKEGFLNFAGDSAFLGKKSVFRKLLCDRAAALYFLPHNIADKRA